MAEEGQLLVVDLRALPGMEGAPLLDAEGGLVALLAPTLRQPSANVDLPLALPIRQVLQALRGGSGTAFPLAAATASAVLTGELMGSSQAATAPPCGPPRSEGRQVAAAAAAAARGQLCDLMPTLAPPPVPVVLHPQGGLWWPPAAAAADRGPACRGEGEGGGEGEGWEGRRADTQWAGVAAAAAMPSVVAVTTTSGSWASGVVVGAHGCILTVKHLLGGRQEAGLQVHVRVAGKLGGSARAAGYQWQRADVVHVFQGTFLPVHVNGNE